MEKQSGPESPSLADVPPPHREHQNPPRDPELDLLAEQLEEQELRDFVQCAEDHLQQAAELFAAAGGRYERIAWLLEDTLRVVLLEEEWVEDPALA